MDEENREESEDTGTREQGDEDTETEKESEKTEMSIDNNPDKSDFSKVKDKVKGNPWMIVSIVLGLVVLLLVINMFAPFMGITGNVISESDAGQKILDFADSQGIAAELVEVNKKSGLYEVVLFMQGRDVPVYVTLDGENLVSGLTPLGVITQPSQTQQTSEEYSEEDLEKISVFIDCLAKKGVKIYGANWCGWTKKLVVQTLGGFDIAAPIYVECTENEELCSSEEVSGYPTIKINQELYKGARTFEGFAESTGCSAPEVEQVQTASNEEASC